MRWVWLGGVLFCTTNKALTTDQFMHKAVDAWTIADVICSIATADRPQMMRQLVQANLNLYAAVACFADHGQHMVAEQDVYELTETLRLITAVSKNITEPLHTADAQCVQIVTDELMEQWKLFLSNLVCPGNGYCTRQAR